MKKMFLFVCLVLLSTPVFCEAATAEHKTLAIGTKVPDFDLKGFTVNADGGYTEQRYQLKAFADAKLILLIFTGNHCPTAQAYEDRIKQYVKEYRNRGVAVVGISSNNPEALRLDELGYSDMGDSYAETQQRAREIGFDFPYLWDGDEQVMARIYGAAATPHAFILDEQRVLRYQGRIDNNEDPSKTTQYDVRDALEALLQGQEPPVTQTRTFGCSLKWLSKKVSAKEGLAKMQKETASLETIDADGIRDLIKNDSEKLRLINVWASWCGACVAEFPDLVNIHRIYRNRDFEVITLSMDSVDQQDKTLAFLNKQAASCRNTISSVEDRDQLAEALDPSWNGVLPYTMLVAPGGKIIYRHIGMIEPAEMKREIVDYLGRYFFKPKPKPSTQSDNEKVDMNNYYAWCIVPFDSVQRSPQQRIEMLKELGFTKYAYDWREKHLAEFSSEIKIARENQVEIMAVWMWIDAVNDRVGKLNPLNEKLLKMVGESGLKTQIWLGFHANYFENLSDEEAVTKGAEIIGYLSNRASQIGCKVALYNHGDWIGDPRNQVKIIEALPSKDIGIIYNFHHAHDQLDEYEELINVALPYLWSVNLNGMRKEGPKILTIGEGDREVKMLDYLTKKGFKGPYGVLCHIETEDAKIVLQRNIDGLINLNGSK